MIGGNGNDVFIVDDAGDKTQETSTGGTDTVQSTITHTLASYIENLTLIGTDAIDGTGNRSANVLTGNSAANLLLGDDGNDTVTGGSGNDTLVGGAGTELAVRRDRGRYLYRRTLSPISSPRRQAKAPTRCKARSPGPWEAMSNNWS